VRRGWLAAGALLLVSGTAYGQQIDFGRVSLSGDERLSWRWRGAGGNDRSTAFTLTKDAIAEAEASFRDFSMEGMWRTLEAALRDEVAAAKIGAQIKLTRNLDGLNWTITGPDQRSVDQLSRKVKERLDRDQEVYLKHYLRQRVGQRIIVDYAAAARAQQKPIRAAVAALRATPNVVDSDRARIALALGFFQQIPYAVLEDKVRRGGDFLPAPALLAQNRGDCDSKAVALAAVLRTYTPSRKLVMVTMPGHAILAADLASDPEDWAIRSDGKQYVALEAAGPAMSTVGQVGSLTARYLKEGREIEIWPLN
jgi:hypothetical protein